MGVASAVANNKSSLLIHVAVCYTYFSAAFTTKTVRVGDNSVLFQIWDTAGQEKVGPPTTVPLSKQYTVLSTVQRTGTDVLQRLSSCSCCVRYHR